MQYARIILEVLGGLGLVLFLGPVLFHIFHLGSFAGAVFSLLVLLLGLFWPQLCGLTSHLWMSGAGRAVLSILLALLILGLFLTCYLTFLMVKGACTRPTDNATVIVLGAQVRGKSPSRALIQRMDRALQYMEEHPGSVCIVSGGKGPDEEISEADCMFQYMTKQGLDPSRIYVEDRSTTTRENLHFSREIIKREGLNPEVALVTHEYHCYRSLMIAGKLGMKAGTVPAASTWWMLPSFYVRELFGILHHAFLADSFGE